MGISAVFSAQSVVDARDAHVTPAPTPKIVTRAPTRAGGGSSRASDAR
jgi:hypothetical protein